MLNGAVCFRDIIRRCFVADRPLVSPSSPSSALGLRLWRTCSVRHLADLNTPIDRTGSVKRPDFCMEVFRKVAQDTSNQSNMVVQSIPRTLFEQLRGHLTSSSSIQEDYEWFAERSRILIGYISRSMRSDDWMFVVEGRDERGQFHAVESREHIRAPETARALLEESIRRLMATGLKVFPRAAR